MDLQAPQAQTDAKGEVPAAMACSGTSLSFICLQCRLAWSGGGAGNGPSLHLLPDFAFQLL